MLGAKARIAIEMAIDGRIALSDPAPILETLQELNLEDIPNRGTKDWKKYKKILRKKLTVLAETKGAKVSEYTEDGEITGSKVVK